ncbi:ABC transporter permease [Virgibacillus ihumii]|uniref:ABC transporter permease n=1 Tax=Virgibacillus ihumii TaxID=2686091 RepID=UPI00157C0F32|nr:hypothetical protein [Virgibacillus ihumii]
MTVVKIFKQPLVLIGTLFILTILCISISYSLFVGPPDPLETTLVYNDNGKLISKHPLPPSEKYPMGTDRDGVSMLYKIIQGAKYTIGFALVVAVCRMVLAILASITFATFLKKLRPSFKSLFDSFTYAPAALVVFVIVSPVIMIYSWAFTDTEKIIFTLASLTFIALPALALTISEEITEIEKYEFITCARSLGSSRLQLLLRHVKPFLSSRLFILFAQQIVQVFLLLAHLGILGLFVGGTNLIVEDTSLEIGNQSEMVSSSASYEWSGLIAAAHDVITIYPWMIYFPVIALTLTILAMVFIVEGLKNVLLKQKPSSIDRKKEKQATVQISPIKTESFKFLHDNRKVM